MPNVIADLLARSNIVEVANVETDEASGSSKIVVRVREEKPWIRLMTDLLKATHGVETFGLEVHKAFYVDDESKEVRFAWVILHWGDVDETLVARVEPILARKVAAPPPFALGRSVAKTVAVGTSPKPAPRSAPAPKVQLPGDEVDAEEPGPDIALRRNTEGVHRIKFLRALDNGTEEYAIPLPHVRRAMYEQNRNPHEVVTLRTPKGRFRAVVQGRDEAEFAPTREIL